LLCIDLAIDYSTNRHGPEMGFREAGNAKSRLHLNV
jgi:hypothetical protein